MKNINYLVVATLIIGFAESSLALIAPTTFIANLGDVVQYNPNTGLISENANYSGNPEFAMNRLPASSASDVQANSMTLTNKRSGYFITAFKADPAAKYPDFIDEAKIDPIDGSGNISQTKFSSGAASVRTNCSNTVKWGALTGKGQNFQCVTATPDFCNKLNPIKKAVGANNFKDTNAAVAKCSALLQPLADSAKDLNTYIKSDKTYAKLASSSANDMQDFRNNIMPDSAKVTFTKFGPDNVTIFDASSAKSDSENLGNALKSIQNLSTAIDACNSLEAANLTVYGSPSGQNAGQGLTNQNGR